MPSGAWRAGQLARYLQAPGGFLLLAIAWTWPLARFMSWRVPHDPGDPVLNTWILWWNTQAWPFTEAWWSPPVFFPLRGTFALSEHLLGIAAITTPLQFLGADALTAYNVSLILSFALSGYFAYLLARHVISRAGTGLPRLTITLGAICAGVAFGFTPYRASQLSHLQVLTSQWMPLALLALHRYVDGGRRAWLYVFAAAWLLQSLSNGYYLLFFPVLIVLWMAWFVEWRSAPERGRAIALAWVVSSILLVPTLVEYREVHSTLGLQRTTSEMRMFSGGLAALTNVPHMVRFWTESPGNGNQEVFLFPGYTAVGLVAIGIVGFAFRRRTARPLTAAFVFYAGATLLMWWLAAGPAPDGALLGVVRWPYTLLTYFPGYNGLRVPARFAMLGYLTLGVAAGLAFARVAPASRVGGAALASLVLAGLFVDGWTRPIPLTPPPLRTVLPDVPGATVLELPADDDRINTAAMYRAMSHRLPLVNGYSGHTPSHYRILTRALRRGDTSIFTELARGRPLIVRLHAERDPSGQFRSMIESVPGVQMRAATNAGQVFVVPAQPAARVTPHGAPFPATVTHVDPNAARIDLGTVRTVRTLAFPLRGRYLELGERFEIEGSQDGETWTSLWLDWTGALALTAALENPREVPMRFTLPDIAVRYLRIHPAPAWMERELTVHGPQ